MINISSRSLQVLPCIDLRDFKPSCITVVEGSSGLVPEVLFRLCAVSVVSFDRDAVFVDGGNMQKKFSAAGALLMTWYSRRMYPGAVMITGSSATSFYHEAAQAGGIETLPRQTIRCIITDHKSRRFNKRVKVQVM